MFTLNLLHVFLRPLPPHLPQSRCLCLHTHTHTFTAALICSTGTVLYPTPFNALLPITNICIWSKPPLWALRFPCNDASHFPGTQQRIKMTNPPLNLSVCLKYPSVGWYISYCCELSSDCWQCPALVTPSFAAWFSTFGKDNCCHGRNAPPPSTPQPSPIRMGRIRKEPWDQDVYMNT